jgi:hypothetical protein
MEGLISYPKVSAGLLRRRASARRSARVDAEEKNRPMMTLSPVIESARLSMLEARKALEDYERLEGVAPSSKHSILTRVFSKATQAYLKLSASQP